jgi:protein-L-isoaspartate(D-aspartate) O-methyltransferase
MKILSRLSLCLLAAVGASPAGTSEAADGTDAYARERRRMLDEIILLTRESRLETGRVVLSEKVQAAIAKIPRHEFVPPDERRHAYENRPLSIGHGQTI